MARFALILLVGFSLAVVSLAGPVFGEAPDDVVNVGNRQCPVSGGPVDGGSFVVHEGKRYGLCCGGCKGMFLKDPQQYIAKMKEQEPELDKD